MPSFKRGFEWAGGLPKNGVKALSVLMLLLLESSLLSKSVEWSLSSFVEVACTFEGSNKMLIAEFVNPK